MLIDTHAHVNFKPFRDDADEVIKRALSDSVWVILVGSEYKTSKRALEYANKYEKGVYAAVGLHPIHEQATTARDDEYDINTVGEEFNYDMYEKLGQFEKTVAIGEIGLDYYHLPLDQHINIVKQKQKQVFLSQLDLAMNLNLPTIIHCRQAHDDMLEILRQYRKEHKPNMPIDRPWGVMHCFSGDEDLAWQYFNLGLLISFTGLITFSSQWDTLIRKVPLDKIMVETDAPYMTPEPHRGKRNEPILVEYVAKRIAEIKNITIERVAEETTRNAKQLFAI
jgi:TatD DNase family protein